MTLKEAIDTYDFEMGLHYGEEKHFIKPEKMDEAREVLLKFLVVEEEFGIDLTKLLTAKKIYYYDEIFDKKERKSVFVLKETDDFGFDLKEKQVIMYEPRSFDGILLEKDEYGKKTAYGWAFTKEELE